MKCRVCRIKEAEANSIVCGEKCNNIRLRIINMVKKYTPTNGCDNCWGDLRQGCTNKCVSEFKLSAEFAKELWGLVEEILNQPTMGC